MEINYAYYDIIGGISCLSIWGGQQADDNPSSRGDTGNSKSQDGSYRPFKVGVITWNWPPFSPFSPTAWFIHFVSKYICNFINE